MLCREGINVCYREEFKRCKIHLTDKICLELVTFNEFAAAALQTVDKYTVVYHHMIVFNLQLKSTV